MKIYRFAMLFMVFGIYCRTESIFCEVYKFESPVLWPVIIFLLMGILGIFYFKNDK